MSKRIRLLTFDLDNTLWDVNLVIRRAEATMIDWLDRHRPHWRAIGPAGLPLLRQQILQAHPQFAHDLTTLRKLLLLELLLQTGHSREDARTGSEMAFDAFYSERNQVELFPGVRQTLESLSKDYELHALSNGNADIHRAGLGDLFQHHFSAAGVGRAKPHPDMFLAALKASGHVAAEAVHIGDHPEQDVAAAQALHWRTVWANFDASNWPLAQPADAEIRRFDQLVEVVETLQR